MSAVLHIPEWVCLYYLQPKCTAVFNIVTTTAIQRTVNLHFAKYFFKFINFGKIIVQFMASWPCQNKFANQNWVVTQRFINASVYTGSRQRSRRIISYLPISILLVSKHVQDCNVTLKHLTPNDHFSGRTAPLTSRRCILYIYSTSIRTEYFKHSAHSPFFPLQNAVYFIMLPFLVPVLFTFYIQVC
jgi:hypothetical protein